MWGGAGLVPINDYHDQVAANLQSTRELNQLKAALQTPKETSKDGRRVPPPPVQVHGLMRAGSPRPQDVIALARAEAAWIDQQGLLPVHSEQLLNVEPSNPPALNNGKRTSDKWSVQETAVARCAAMRDDLLRRLFKGVQEIERQSQEGSGMLRGDRTLMLRGLTRVVDALREASIDCAEAIKEWKQAANKPFEWNGRIYGARMLCDVATLDKFRFVASWLGFSSIGNPFLLLPEGYTPVAGRHYAPLRKDQYKSIATRAKAALATLAEESKAAEVQHKARLASGKLTRFQQLQQKQSRDDSEWSLRLDEATIQVAKAADASKQRREGINQRGAATEHLVNHPYSALTPRTRSL